jgi:hypothetical protein
MERVLGGLSCGTGRHKSSKFQPSIATFYIKHTDHQAFCQPTLDMNHFLPDQVQVLSQKMLTALEWSETFERISNDFMPLWLPVTDNDDKNPELEPEDLALKTLGILSPTQDNQAIFGFQPTLSFDSMDSSQLVNRLDEGLDLQWRSEVTPLEFLKYVDTINKRVTKFKDAWSKPFQDIESSYRLLVSDIKLMSGGTTFPSG